MFKIEAQKTVAGYEREYENDKRNGYWGSLTDWALEKCYTGRPKYRYPFGSAFDIHKSIGRLPKPRSGWTLPDHKCTGPYNDLESQRKYNPNTGEKLEIYDQPTGKTDAIAMQHDVNYAVCKDKKKMQE